MQKNSYHTLNLETWCRYNAFIFSRRLKARDYVNASQNQSIINKIPYFNHFKRANNSLQISSKFISNKDHTFRHEFNEDNMLLNCTETNFQNTRNEHLDTQIQNDSIFFQNNVRLANLNVW